MVDTNRAIFVTVGAPALILALFLVGKGCIWVFSSEYETAKAAEHTWEHTTHLRQRRIYHDDRWYSAPQAKGYYDEPTFNVRCEMRMNGSICVARDKDGFCTMSVPDFDPWCQYDYYDWPIIKSESVVGANYEFSWHTFVPEGNDLRESKTAKYWIKFVNSKGSWTYKTDSLDEYRKIQPETVWELKFPHIGSFEPTKQVNLEKL